jgi:protein involved in polysaccharide export with SLBB domain
LFEYYGNGLPVYADDTRVQITRYDDETDKDGHKFYIDYSKDKNFELCDSDDVYVPSYRSLKPVMFMEGAIGSAEGVDLDASTKRTIQFEKGTKYDDLIKRYAGYFTAVSDISNAYIIRDAEIIPLDLSKILYDSSYVSNLLIEPYDTLRIPFKQYFVSVAGSVVAPGRYPYIPDRTWEYYIGLAGGFIKTQNNKDAIKIVDINGNQLSKTDIITPETTITADTNSGLYYFNLYAPVVTTVLTLISTTLSILAVTGVFK